MSRVQPDFRESLAGNDGSFLQAEKNHKPGVFQSLSKTEWYRPRIDPMPSDFWLCLKPCPSCRSRTYSNGIKQICLVCGWGFERRGEKRIFQ